MSARNEIFKNQPLLSGYKSNSVCWLGKVVLGFGAVGWLSAVKSEVFSNNVRLRVCEISERLRSMSSSFFTIATSTHTLIAIQTWVFTALSLVPSRQQVLAVGFVDIRFTAVGPR